MPFGFRRLYFRPGNERLRRNRGSGIEVEVFQYGLWIKGAFTDSSGDYIVEGLPAGSYYVRTYNDINDFLIDEFYDNIIAKSSTV
jgi:hypothetical protein